MIDIFRLALVINVAVSAYMAGVIWIIQILLYPLFLQIQIERFLRSHAKHTFWMGILVGPVMSLELLVAVYLLFQVTAFLFLFNLALVLGTWALTFLVSVPVHSRLAVAYDETNIHKLIITNWPRTILWSLKLIIALFLWRL